MDAALEECSQAWTGQGLGPRSTLGTYWPSCKPNIARTLWK